MGDGQRIFLCDPKQPNQDTGDVWQAIKMNSTNLQLRGITRLAMHPSGKLLAVVAEE